MWHSYIKTALRILIRNRRFSVINFLGLSIGLASFIIIMSWVKDEISFDRFHEKRGRIYQLTIMHPDGILDPNTPYAMVPGMADRYPEIVSFSTVMRMESRISCSFVFNPDSLDPVKAYEPSVARVNTGFFKIFDFPFIYGDRNDPLSDAGNAVISKEIADKYFPSINPVGRTILINNAQLLTISAVVDIPGNTFFRFDFFLPVTENLSNDWNWRDPAFLLLMPGIDIGDFKNKIASFFEDNFPDALNGKFEVGIIPVYKTHLAFGQKGKVFMFSCIAILLLLVAALNYMNLTSANYSGRAHEMGIRKMLGVGRTGLLFNFFTESFILVFAALLAGLFLAELALPVLKPLFGRRIEIGYLNQPFILLVLLIVAGFISILSSIFPSILFSKGNPTDVLHLSVGPGTRKSVLILVTTIFQFTLSILLMISTLVVISQVRFTTGADLGFSYKNVMAIPMNQGIGNNFEAFLERLESHAGIEMVSAGQAHPFNEDYKTSIDWSTKGNNIDGLCRYSICLNNYPDLFGMQIVNGRAFSEDFGADNDKYVINETAARMLGYENPVGQSISMWNREGEIIGVVKDFHHVSMQKEILPHVFNIHPSNYRGLRFIFIRLASLKNPEVLGYIESVCQNLAPEYPFSYSFLEDEAQQLYASDRNLSRILGLFSILILVISGLGIYGLAFYSVESKTREIAVRKVYGASLWSVLFLIYKSLLSRLGISLVLAVGLSLFVVTRWLQNFAYRINPDILHFLLPALLAFMVAVISTLIAMWRSVRQNPADQLKQE